MESDMKYFKNKTGGVYAISPIQTPDKEWVALTEKETKAHLNPEISLEQAKVEKLRQIDAETSAAIFAGFDYEVDGDILHFAYDTNDQQNFADTANMVNLSLKGIPGVPESIPWNGWKIEGDEDCAEVSRSLVRLDLDANAFLALYMQGAMMHKAGLMELGGQRKAQVDVATTIEELEGI